jgi:hypothetical protein
VSTNQQFISSLNSNDKTVISDIIRRSNIHIIASDIDEILKQKSFNIQNNPQFREAVFFAIELVLMMNVRKREEGKKSIDPLFSTEFYSILNSIL